MTTAITGPLGETEEQRRRRLQGMNLFTPEAIPRPGGPTLAAVAGLQSTVADAPPAAMGSVPFNPPPAARLFGGAGPQLAEPWKAIMPSMPQWGLPGQTTDVAGLIGQAAAMPPATVPPAAQAVMGTPRQPNDEYYRALDQGPPNPMADAMKNYQLDGKIRQSHAKIEGIQADMKPLEDAVVAARRRLTQLRKDEHTPPAVLGMAEQQLRETEALVEPHMDRLRGLLADHGELATDRHIGTGTPPAARALMPPPTPTGATQTQTPTGPSTVTVQMFNERDQLRVNLQRARDEVARTNQTTSYGAAPIPQIQVDRQMKVEAAQRALDRMDQQIAAAQSGVAQQPGQQQVAAVVDGRTIYQNVTPPAVAGAMPTQTPGAAGTPGTAGQGPAQQAASQILSPFPVQAPPATTPQVQPTAGPGQPATTGQAIATPRTLAQKQQDIRHMVEHGASQGQAEQMAGSGRYGNFGYLLTEPEPPPGGLPERNPDEPAFAGWQRYKQLAPNNAAQQPGLLKYLVAHVDTEDVPKDRRAEIARLQGLEGDPYRAWQAISKIMDLHAPRELTRDQRDRIAMAHKDEVEAAKVSAVAHREDYLQRQTADKAELTVVATRIESLRHQEAKLQADHASLLVDARNRPSGNTRDDIADRAKAEGAWQQAQDIERRSREVVRAIQAAEKEQNELLTRIRTPYAPPGAGKAMTRAQAAAIYAEAGNDLNRATALARQRGFDPETPLLPD